MFKYGVGFISPALMKIITCQFVADINIGRIRLVLCFKGGIDHNLFNLFLGLLNFYSAIGINFNSILIFKIHYFIRFYNTSITGY